MKFATRVFVTVWSVQYNVKCVVKGDCVVYCGVCTTVWSVQYSVGCAVKFGVSSTVWSVDYSV